MVRIALLLAVLAGQARADHWIDLPAWPKPTPAAAHVSWVVSPLAATLEVEAGGITRAIILDPLPASESYQLKRTGDALMVMKRDHQVAKLHVPAKMKLETR